ncbi:MAG: Do family serine endopeptidase [Spirochaetales bacterium]|nr:Do family serine endopeptidase [Spirochaetales bacterium]
MNIKKIFSILILILAITGIISAESNYYTYSRSQNINHLEAIQNANREIAKAVLPAVVSIDVVNIIERQNNGNLFSSPLEFFFGRPEQNKDNERKPETQEFRSTAMGSGVIVRKDNKTVYVLTNNHVVAEADEITIHLNDERIFEAEIVGTDPRRDIALVKFETKEDIPVARLGNSDDVQVGDISFAIGNPLGFSSTFTSGVISAVGRNGGERLGAGFTDFIQTDAAINPGNSGGALVNIYGEVIGINTWIASQTGGNIGLGFSIPINRAKEIIDDLIESGRVEYGWLGISMGDPSENLVKSMNLSNRSGAFVFNVYKKSPAWNGGIKPGDFITSIDNKKIEDGNDLLKIVGNLEPGNQYLFKIVRKSKPVNVYVDITARDDEDTIRNNSNNLWPGLTVVEITNEIQERLNLPKNIGKVMIGSVIEGSPSHTAGMRNGDIIKEINKKKINNLMDFYEILNRSNNELIFKVNKQGTDIILGIVQ